MREWLSWTYQWQTTFDQQTNDDGHQWIWKYGILFGGKIPRNCPCKLHLQINRIIDGHPSPSSRPVSTMTHCNGSTRMPYFNRFSSNSLNPPIVNSRKPQLTRPVKSWKPELHENSESLGRWHLQNENENNVELNKRAKSDRFNCKFIIFMGCFAWTADAMTSAAYVNETRDIYGRRKEEEEEKCSQRIPPLASSSLRIHWTCMRIAETMKPKQ